MLGLLIQIYSLVVLAAVIVSWVQPSPDHPLVRLIRNLTEPVLEPLRKIIPPVAGFDLTPMALLLGLRFLAHLL